MIPAHIIFNLKFTSPDSLYVENLITGHNTEMGKEALRARFPHGLEAAIRHYRNGREWEDFLK